MGSSKIQSALKDLTVPIGSLRPYARNPRRGDVGLIAESLERNGQYRPLVVNRPTGEVLAGNHTLLAARQLGWSEIAVTYVDVNDAQAQRIVLVDNRASDVAGYDDELLAELLKELPDLEGSAGTPTRSTSCSRRSATPRPARRMSHRRLRASRGLRPGTSTPSGVIASSEAMRARRMPTRVCSAGNRRRSRGPTRPMASTMRAGRLGG